VDLPEDTVLGQEEGDISEGEEVEKLQEELEKLGYELGDEAPGEENFGEFGDHTKEAIEHFQTQKGLEQVDGRVGPETAPALNKSLAADELPGVLKELNEEIKKLNKEVGLELIKRYRELAKKFMEKAKESDNPDEVEKYLEKANEMRK